MVFHIQVKISKSLIMTFRTQANMTENSLFRLVWMHTDL